MGKLNRKNKGRVGAMEQKKNAKGMKQTCENNMKQDRTGGNNIEETRAERG